MTKAEVEELVRPYVGNDLYKIGTEILDKSVYNHNFVRLPNGTEVLLQNDDEGFNDVAVVDGDALIYVGGQWDNRGLELGEFT